MSSRQDGSSKWTYTQTQRAPYQILDYNHKDHNNMICCIIIIIGNFKINQTVHVCVCVLAYFLIHFIHERVKEKPLII